MKEVLMTFYEIDDEIAFEDECKVCNLVQELLVLSRAKVDFAVYKQINDLGENCGWVVRDKKTNKIKKTFIFTLPAISSASERRHF